MKFSFRTSKFLTFAGLFLFLFLQTVKSNATHLLGGELSYSRNSTGTYNIKLQLYFDQVNGNPGALDDSVLITAFDAATNQELYTFYLPLVGSTSGPCIPTCSYCVYPLTYELTDLDLSLLPPAGLVLVYDRCCRSNIVQNILNPGGTGMLFYTIIPSVANNSAVFSFPVLPAVEVNSAFSFDGSATDADGDELHYLLDKLYYGSASQTNPLPTSGAPLPANLVPWQVGYSATNMLGSGVPLQIDYNTGLITATPGTIGLFQIAYLVEEHRNGQIISTTRNEIMVYVTDAASAFMR